MSTNLSDFSKKKELLFCIDSDGCAMDTMDVKHIRCFGPCMVEDWGLQAWETSTMDALVENLVTGVEAFKGKDPIDSFCGLWDAKI